MASFMSELLKENSSRIELAAHESLVIDIVDDNAKQCPDSTTLNRCQSMILMRGSRSRQRLCRWTHEYDRTSSKNDPIAKSERHETSSNFNKSSIKRASSDTMLLRLPQRKLSPRITSKTKVTVRGKNGDDRSNSHPSANAQWNLPKDAELNPESTVKPKRNPFLDKLSVMSLEEPCSPSYVKV